MGEQASDVQTISVGEAGNDFEALLDGVRRTHERVLVSDEAGPVAAIISVKDFERLQQLDAERARDFAVAERMRMAFAGVPFEEIEDEAEKALAEVRAEMRRERAGRTTSTD